MNSTTKPENRTITDQENFEIMNYVTNIDKRWKMKFRWSSDSTRDIASYIDWKKE